jgi:hypothetical protein
MTVFKARPGPEKDAFRQMEPLPKLRELTFEEIAELQGVRPIEDPNELVGGWPGEVDDGFEEAVRAWRRQG